jgi:hypothetical protein
MVRGRTYGNRNFINGDSALYFSQEKVVINVCDIHWQFIRVIQLPRVPSVDDYIVFMLAHQKINYHIKHVTWAINEKNHLSVMLACEIYTEDKRPKLGLVPDDNT